MDDDKFQASLGDLGKHLSPPGSTSSAKNTNTENVRHAHCQERRVPGHASTEALAGRRRFCSLPSSVWGTGTPVTQSHAAGVRAGPHPPQGSATSSHAQPRLFPLSGSASTHTLCPFSSDLSWDPPWPTLLLPTLSPDRRPQCSARLGHSALRWRVGEGHRPAAAALPQGHGGCSVLLHAPGSLQGCFHSVPISPSVLVVKDMHLGDRRGACPCSGP